MEEKKKYKTLGKDYSIGDAYSAIASDDHAMFSIFKAALITFIAFTLVTVILAIIFSYWLLLLATFWAVFAFGSWKKYNLFKPKKGSEIL